MNTTENIESVNSFLQDIFDEIFSNVRITYIHVFEYIYDICEMLDDYKIFGPRRYTILNIVNILSVSASDVERADVMIERYLLDTYRSASDEVDRLLAMEYYELLYDDNFPLWSFIDVPNTPTCVAAPAA